jgi:hypothetical protein
LFASAQTAFDAAHKRAEAEVEEEREEKDKRRKLEAKIKQRRAVIKDERKVG